MSTEQNHPTLNIQIAALGGEGGGVLMNWVVAAARQAGHGVQATSVPGVAQRTGSTSYYIEIDLQPGNTRRDARQTGAEDSRAVFTLVPMPGRVDVLLSSELVETARALSTGFVSPDRTTVISSTARVFSTAEKIQMGDGRYAGENVIRAVDALSHESILLDLGQLAVDHGTFVSATMFGALAGSGKLPWPANVSRAILSDERSRAGFNAAFDAVADIRAAASAAPGEALQDTMPSSAPDLPSELAEIVRLGSERCVDYQDDAYAAEYDMRCRRLIEAGDLSNPTNLSATIEACRRLALWMAYEDVARVADLKTRRERFAHIRSEAKLKPGELLAVIDYLKPRAEEVADVMPAAIGRWIMRRVERGKGLPFLGRGVRLRSNGVIGYWLLRMTANMRRMRRKSLRFQEEQVAIEDWLGKMVVALAASPKFAEPLAELPRVLKGYSDTLLRGKTAYGRIMSELVEPGLANGPGNAQADDLRAAIAAALADDQHERLDQVLASVANNERQLEKVANG